MSATNSLSRDVTNFPNRLLKMLEEVASRDPATAMALIAQWRRDVVEEMQHSAAVPTDPCMA